jgi:hypothetical protein
VPKKTINPKEVLADIKAEMANNALMEKYQLSEKCLQSLPAPRSGTTSECVSTG